MKKTIVQTLIGVMVLCLLGACSKAGGNDENGNNSSDGQHTYEISIAGGKIYKGGVPRYAPGVVTMFNPVAFVNEQNNGKAIAVMLAEAGAFQIGLGFLLDDDNKPIHTEVQAFGFGEWATEDKYGPAGHINLTLENYKEHTISSYGDEATVASFTLNFNGKFKLGADGEEVDVTGKIVVAEP